MVKQSIMAAGEMVEAAYLMAAKKQTEKVQRTKYIFPGHTLVTYCL
jgi:hypothetical protein